MDTCRFSGDMAITKCAVKARRLHMIGSVGWEGHVKTELLHMEFCSSSVLRGI